MHDHSYKIELLKTPMGFLTTTGFTDDINNPDIIFCASNTYGKWSSTKNRIPYFSKKYIGSEDIEKILFEMVDDIEAYGFMCEKGTLCTTGNEPDCKKTCPFWTWGRNLGMFFRHY